MPATSNNIRHFFGKITTSENKIKAAGGVVSDSDRMLIITNGFDLNVEWKARVEQLKSTCRLNNIPITYAKIKQELLLLGKPFETDADDDSTSSKSAIDAITLATHGDHKSDKPCGACYYRLWKRDFSHTGIWDAFQLFQANRLQFQ